MTHLTPPAVAPAHRTVAGALLSALAVVGLAVAGLTAQAGSKPLIQNDRVVVWDLAAGTAAPSNAAFDSVLLAIRGSEVEVTFQAKGATATPAAQALRRILIQLQDKTTTPIVNKSGYPNAFPRSGSKRVLDTPRVVAWDYTWTLGQPTPMHFHDKDVIVTYLAEGELTSTDPAGQSVVNPHHFGFTKFNTRDRVHTETLTKGQGRAIIVELK